MAFLHIASGNAGELQGLLHFGEEEECLLRGTHIGLADDFDERCAGAVEIDVGVALGVFEAIVLGLAGVIFHVDAGDVNAFDAGCKLDVEPAAQGDGLIELGDLVALGEIRIEVILAGEDGLRLDFAVEGKPAAYGEFNGVAAENRQRAREAEAHGADVGVRSVTGFDGAGAEDLGARGELDVDFQPDYEFILGQVRHL